MLLQGHCNPITAVCVSNDKRWIATADCGDDSMIVVWDSLKATPIKIIQQPYAKGIVSLDISSDSLFLATLSAGEDQQISVWEWTVGTNDPAMTAFIGNEHEKQHSVRFNSVDVRDIVSNGASQVIFWNWNEAALTPFHPPRGIQKLKKAVGTLTQTVFLPYTTKAVTATDTGNVVLWDYPVSELVQSTGRDAIKILKLIKSGITLMSTVLDRYVVCGCLDGAVRFFDFQFRVVAWFEDVKAGAIASVSFSEDTAPQTAVQNTGDVNMSDFQVPDFVVGTVDGKIIALQSRLMEQVSEEKRRGNLLVQGFSGDVSAMDSHPALPIFAVGTTSGTLQLWDIDDRVINASRSFPKTGAPHSKNNDLMSGDKNDDEEVVDVSNVLTSLKFAPQGDILAVGFANGHIKLLSVRDAIDGAEEGDSPLADITHFKNTNGTILDICFSKDGQYLATADSLHYVSLYRYWHQDEELDKPVDWIFVGKFKSHFRNIVSIYFEAITQAPGEQADLPPKLFSLGEDRILQEYDVAKSSIRGGVKLKNSTRVEQESRPTCFVSIPGRAVMQKRDPEAEEEEGQKQIVFTPDLLVVANDEYKLRVWDLSSNLEDVDYFASHGNNYIDHHGNAKTDQDSNYCTGEKNTKVCRKTLLGPTYGGPINKVFVLPRRQGNKVIPSQYLVYSTHEKVVGLIKMPFDGNPNKSMALIAHPGEVHHICSSFDGKYVLTSGGVDRSVHLWNVNVSALDAAVSMGGTGIEPFIALLQGGAGGEFYQDMLDYFYYAQLRSQGLNTTLPRKITGFISSEEVIPLMCALGYYPTKDGIRDIQNEVKFAHQAQRGIYKGKVDLEEFIKMYVNHRPVYGCGTLNFRLRFKQLIDADKRRVEKAKKQEEEEAAKANAPAPTSQKTVPFHDPHAARDEEELLREVAAMNLNSLKIGRNALLEKLKTLGECMTEEELEECINNLMGKASEPVMREVADLMSGNYEPNTFASEVLGFTQD